MGLLLSTIGYSQFIQKSEITIDRLPNKVLKGFNAKYGDAKMGQWYKIGATTYEVIVKHEKQTKLITLDWEGVVHDELVKVKTGDLPKEKKVKLLKKYKDLKIKAVYQDLAHPNVFIVEGDNNGKIIQVKT